MKPTRDGEGVASDKTSENLPYPNPNIERDKVETRYCLSDDESEMFDRALRRSAKRIAVAVPIEELDELKAAITASEKRAEEAEMRFAIKWRDDRELTEKLAKAESERDEARDQVDAVHLFYSDRAAILVRTLVERDEARAVSDSLSEQLYELAGEHAAVKSERDSLRSSLMRVSGEREKFWLIVNIARDLINGPPGPHVSVDEAGSWDVIVREQMAKALSALQASGDG